MKNQLSNWVVMVLGGYGSNENRLGYEKKWIEWFTIPLVSIFIKDYHLQHKNFLSLSDKESVIVRPCYHCPYFEEDSQDSLAPWSFDGA